MKKFLNLKTEYSYSVDNYSRVIGNEIIVGNINKGSILVYTGVIRFEDLKNNCLMKPTKSIINIYVENVLGGNSIPIEAINSNNGNSKVFWINSNGIQHYNKLDISELVDCNMKVEFYFKCIDKRNGIVKLSGKDDEFPAILEVEYDEVSDDKGYECKKEEVSKTNTFGEGLRIDEESTDKEMFNVIKEMYIYFSKENDKLRIELERLVRMVIGLVNKECEEDEKCDKGEPGEKGAQGIKGDKGEVGERGAQGIKGDKGDKGEVGERGISGDLMINYGYFRGVSLKRIEEKAINKIVFLDEISKEIHIDEDDTEIIINISGIYLLRFILEVTAISLGVPKVFVQVNNINIGNEISGVGIPHQALNGEVLVKLYSGDKISIGIKNISEQSMVMGSITILGIN